MPTNFRNSTQNVKTKMQLDRLLFVGPGTWFREILQLPMAEVVLATDNTQNRHLNVRCSATVQNKKNALVVCTVTVTTQ